MSNVFTSAERVNHPRHFGDQICKDWSRYLQSCREIRLLYP